MAKKKRSVLVIGKRSEDLERLVKILKEKYSHEIRVIAPQFDQAPEKLLSGNFDCVVVDIEFVCSSPGSNATINCIDIMEVLKNQLNTLTVLRTKNPKDMSFAYLKGADFIFISPVSEDSVAKLVSIIEFKAKGI